MDRFCRACLEGRCGSRDESPSSNLGRVKQCESVQVDDMGPQGQRKRGEGSSVNQRSFSRSSRERESTARVLQRIDARQSAGDVLIPTWRLHSTTRIATGCCETVVLGTLRPCTAMSCCVLSGKHAFRRAGGDVRRVQLWSSARRSLWLGYAASLGNSLCGGDAASSTRGGVAARVFNTLTMEGCNDSILNLCKVPCTQYAQIEWYSQVAFSLTSVLTASKKQVSVIQSRLNLATPFFLFPFSFFPFTFFPLLFFFFLFSFFFFIFSFFFFLFSFFFFLFSFFLFFLARRQPFREPHPYSSTMCQYLRCSDPSPHLVGHSAHLP